MGTSGWWFLFVLFCGAHTCCAAEDRNPRGWFDRSSKTITRMVTEREVVTEFLPSSCVVVQTSLPACRHLRAVDSIKPTQPVRIMSTMAPAPTSPMNKQGWKPMIQPSSQSIPSFPGVNRGTPPMRNPNRTTTAAPSFWSNWNPFNFGDREIMVTSTVREIITTKVQDPHTVVTFSVKGCRPSRLPFDLPECHPPKDLEEVAGNDEKDVDAIQMVQEEVQASNVVKADSLETHGSSTPLRGVYNVGVDPGLIVMAPIQLVPNMPPIKMTEDKGKENKKELTVEIKKEEIKSDDNTKVQN